MFCRLNSCTPQTQPQQWQRQYQQLNLELGSLPSEFQIALEQACEQLQVSIAWFSFVESGRVCFAPTLGWEQLHHARSLRSQGLDYLDSYAQYVIDSQQPLRIINTAKQPVFAISPLYQHHGIRAYCGVPLLTAANLCLGVLAVAAPAPHHWQPQDVAWLELLARWCITSQERDCALQQTAQPSRRRLLARQKTSVYDASTDKSPTRKPSAHKPIYEPLMVKLVKELAHELRTPLTSIMGMTRVLEQQVYGELTRKQEEYLHIVRTSGEQLLMLAEEMVTVSTLAEQGTTVNKSNVDVELVVQQVLQQLTNLENQQNHTIHLSVEPGQRLWLLDKEKIIPAIYHLLHSLLSHSNAGSQIYIHIAWHNNEAVGLNPELHLTFWATHPQLMAYSSPQEFDPQLFRKQLTPLLQTWVEQYPIILHLLCVLQAQSLQSQPILNVQEAYRLLLCCELLHLHGGRLSLKSSPEHRYSYIIKLPSTGSITASAPNPNEASGD